MKFILAPDKFKGSLSAAQVRLIMKIEILKTFPQSEIQEIEIADGGEGSLRCFQKILSGKIKTVSVTGPNQQPINAQYLLAEETAVIEMAEASGLLKTTEKNPLKTTSLGTGELIAAALNAGAQKIILCLGGSATNDAGCGLATALGLKFLNSQGKEFIPVGETLKEIKEIDFSEKKEFSLTVLCDVSNPLYGKNGAAYVYAAQKGANQKEIEELDFGLRAFAKIIKTQLNIDLAHLAGGGAAGGIGAGMVCFFGGELKSGVETILSFLTTNENLTADFVLTGEGRLDNSSLQGKVVSGVAQHFKGKVPVLAFVGVRARNLKENKLEELGLKAIYTCLPENSSFTEICQNASADLSFCLKNVLQIIKLSSK